MRKVKNWTTYLVAYAMWIASFLLWLWIMYLGRDLLQGILGEMVADGTFQQQKMAQLADRVYLFGMGLIWLVLMIVVENYFRRGIKKGDLWRRIGRVMGPQLLLAFAVDLGLALFYGVASQPLTRWLVLALECVAGVGFVFLSLKAPRARPAALTR